jgi:dephospho-CoA kinase
MNGPQSMAADKSAIRNLKSKMVIGLVGGIGSGKSLVAAAFARCGGRVISGDVLGHEALRQPDIKQRIVEHWGSRVLDRQGDIDRPSLGAIVFGDPEERRKLEAIVHPYIKRRLAEEFAAAQNEPKVAAIVVDAAIMLEAGWSGACDRIVFVDAPREVRLQRLAQQRGWTEKDVKAREEAQMPLVEKRARSDAVIDNSGAAERVQEQVEQLLLEWKRR